MTDFLKIPAWPAFNVADIAITVGVHRAGLRAGATKTMRIPPERDGRAPRRRARRARSARAARGAAADRRRPRHRRRRGRARSATSVSRGRGRRVDDAAPSRARPSRAATSPFDVAYEDEHLLVVDKPAGVVVHPAKGHRPARWPRRSPAGGRRRMAAGIVHRLDRDTSGLLVVAQDRGGAPAAEGAAPAPRDHPRVPRARPRPPAGAQRHDRRADRPRPPPPHAALDRHRRARARRVTHFEIEQALPETTLLRVRLETGRTHQIRVHLAGDRPPGRRRPRVRRRRRARPRAPVPARRPAGVRRRRRRPSPLPDGPARRRSPQSNGAARPGPPRRLLRGAGQPPEVGEGGPTRIQPQRRRRTELAYTGRTVSVLDPVRGTASGSCPAIEPGSPRPRAGTCPPQDPRSTHVCPTSASASCWRPESTSATRRAAGTRRCAASSTASATASTSSTC